MLDAAERGDEDVAWEEGFEVYEAEGAGGGVEDLGVDSQDGSRRGAMAAAGVGRRLYLRCHYVWAEVYYLLR